MRTAQLQQFLKENKFVLEYSFEQLDGKLDLEESICFLYLNDFVHICKIHKLEQSKTSSNKEKLLAYVKDTIETIDIDGMYFVFKDENFSNFPIAFLTLHYVKDEDGLDYTQIQGFHVHQFYRNASFFCYFWDVIHKNSMGKLIFALTEKNVFAKKHMERNGLQVVGSMIERCKILIMSN